MTRACAFFGCLASLVAALPAAADTPFTVQDLPRVRSICNYLYGEDAHDVATWCRDLDSIKAAGFNTVWMVNVWADYQPSTDSPVWREDRLQALHDICAAARARDMWVIIPLAYIGEGWGPGGVDAAVWPLIEKDRLAHLEALRRITAAVRDCANVFYLLCSEEILPGTLLYTPTKSPECVASFRQWAREANPDIAYWNERWATDYTWDTLTPTNTDNRPRWQLWADHARWHGWLMRRLLPPMVAAIREVHPSAVIGFHDFLMPMGLDLTAADGALELPTPFNFYSIGSYYDFALAGGYDANIADLHKRVETAHALYPGLPIFCGELGYDALVEPGEARDMDEIAQGHFLQDATRYLESQQVGYDIWCWRTVVPGVPRIHSLVRPDGSHRPALQRLTRRWKGGSS